MSSLLPHLHRAVERASLSAAEAHEAMAIILSGEASTTEIAAFLVALRMKGETASEVLGFARAMREKARHIVVNGGPVLDTCGTGGDGAHTFNISTLVAFVVAGVGVKVAKHGNRSISSRCGSADVLECLGVKLLSDPEMISRAISEIGIGFLFAPALHPAMKYVQPARVELKMRTVFNLLGPLTNPAGATAQLVGAPSVAAAELMAGALAELGLHRGFVVHGSDGLDEITTTGPTTVFGISQGVVTRRQFNPQEFGFKLACLDDLRGGEPAENAEIARAVLGGERGCRREIVLLNAAMGLVAAGAQSFAQALSLAAQSIDSGAAAAKLDCLARFTKAG